MQRNNTKIVVQVKCCSIYLEMNQEGNADGQLRILRKYVNNSLEQG